VRTLNYIRLALRLFRRNPSTTAIALVSIALSVAAAAVVFVAMKAVLITPLPYANPERLVQIRTEFGNTGLPSIVDFGFWNDAQEIARRSRTLESVAVYSNVIFDLAGDGSTPPNAVLFGMAPAFRAAFTPPSAAHESRAGALAGKHDRLRSSLVVSEIALAVTLVVIGAQLTRKFVELLRTDPGFDAEHVVASIIVPTREHHSTEEQWALTYREFLNAVRMIPGVTGVGTVNALPFSGENLGGFIAATDAQALRPNSQPIAEVDTVNSDYLQTMGVRLLQGRWFDANDMKPSSTTAIVSDAVAKDLWPGKDAIGERICIDCTPEKPNNWKRVVGVVSDARHRSMDGPPPGAVYLAAGAMGKAVFLVARTDRPIAGLEGAVRRAIASVDPSTPVFLSAPMRAFISDSIANRRFVMTLLAITAALALLMSAAGVYGVVSYATSRRTQEIGLRMALGASRGNVHGLIFRQGFTAVFVGLAIGICMTVALLRVLRGMVAGLEGTNPTTLVISIAVVCVAAATACWLPARRAAKIDPLVALRYE
jgi:predicted permease